MTSSERAFEETLNDDIWKDSFDRLLNKRSLLREMKVIKNDVRISFNNDSSVETSSNNFFKHTDLEDHKNEIKEPSGTISTPILTNKANGPFDCPLSPISSWRLTHFNQGDASRTPCKEKSLPSDNDSYKKSNSKATLPANFSTLHKIPEIKINEENENNGTNSNIITEDRLQMRGENEDANVTVVLPPGKWRRSLTVWKRLNQLKYECVDKIPEKVLKRSSTHAVRNHRPTSVLKRASISCARNSKNVQVDLLKLCEQNKILSFSRTYSDNALRNCRKIGEGTYGEVFLNSNEDGETVLKIIPIEGSTDVNGEPQKSFQQILPEVIISTELSNLRQCNAFRTSGFVYLKNVLCLKGKYPPQLIELWNLYEQNYGSENDHPGMFQQKQLYVALEIAYGGKDLERFVFRNSEQAYAAFLQVTLSLAVAEKCLEFEHRDLHCGNMLIQSTDEKHVEFTLSNNKVKIPTSGIKVTIIDYTLSRILLEKCCYYNDLSEDDELFSAKGDPQYDVYRSMRKALDNNWEKHDPQTNLMWLHYLLTKLKNGVKYKNTRSKQHILYLERMNAIQDTILSYSSTFELASKLYK